MSGSLAGNCSKMLSELPPELIAEILLRLPLIFILQFRCVSRLWCASIDSPYFIKVHLNRSIQTRKNYFLVLGHSNSDLIHSVDFDLLENATDLYNPLNCSRSQELRHNMPRGYGPSRLTPSWYLNLPDIDQDVQIIPPLWQGIITLRRQIRVWGSCNGLLFMSNNFSTCLWNPSTRKHRELPKPEVQLPWAYCPFIFYGFGYDSAHDDYKVVMVVKAHTRELTVSVYSLKSNSWRRSRNFPTDVKFQQEPGVLASEALHWLVGNGEHNFILSFDLKTEEYQMFPQPKCQNTKFYSRLGVFKGSICLIYSYWPIGFEMWVMEEYGVNESWTKIALQQGDFVSYPGGLIYATLRNGGNVFMVQHRRGLCWHEFKDVPTEDSRIQNLSYSDDTNVCLVSLVSLDGGAESGHQNESLN